MRRFGVWLALLLLIPYLQFVGGAWFGLYIAPLRGVTLVLIALVFATWFASAWRDPSWRPQSVLGPAIVASLASLAISTGFSRHLRLSVEYLAYAVVLAGLYLLLVRLLREPFLARRIPGLAVVFASVVGIFFLVAVASRWIQWWELVGRVTFPPLRPAFESFVYGNPSSVLAVVAMFTAAALVVVRGPGVGRLAVSVALIALAGATTLVSGSRAGWLAIGVALLVLVVGALLDRRVRVGISRAVGRVRESRAATAASLVGAVVAAGLAVVLAPGVLRRALEGGDDIRAGFFRTALHMFGQAPVVGTGPGTWVADRIAVTSPDLPDYYIPHAHNVYLQTAAELGLIGIVVGMLVVASIGRLIWRSIRSDDDDRRGWAWAALAVTVYFAVHSMLDFFMNMPAILFPLALPIAVLDARALGPTVTGPQSVPAAPLSAGWSRRGLLAAGVLAAVVVAALVKYELPALANQAAVDAANAGDWAAAVAPAASAVNGDPEIPPLRFTLGLALSRTGDHGGAAREFRDVAEATDFPEAWLNLASELAALGQPDEAVSALENALRLGSQRAAVAMPAGELALRLGDEALAQRAFGAAMATVWTLAADPWWKTTPERRGAFSAALEEALAAIDPPYAWELALLGGDRSLAETLAIDALDPDLADVAIRTWSDEPGAIQELYARCRENPLDLGWLSWCGRIAGREGDGVSAARYRLQAGLTLGGAEEYSAFLRVATTDGVGRWIAGEPAGFWGYYTYRRPTPWDVLVPDLVHLVTR